MRSIKMTSMTTTTAKQTRQASRKFSFQLNTKCARAYTIYFDMRNFIGN